MPRQEDNAPIPVIVLTGFLGSGKTTLLRHILHHPAFADAAVLINEFGEVGLDHLLVGALDQEPVLLRSGCICCTIRGDLSRAIRDLHARRQRGEIPRFRRLIVETTGLADPVPILSTIASDLVIRHHFRTSTILATVDALHAQAGLDAHPELLRQVAAADLLIITKTDLAPAHAVTALRERLSEVNPQAAIAEAVQGAIDPDLLLRAPGTEVPQRVAQSVPAENERRGAHGPIRSFCLSSDEPVSWSGFGLWLSLLVHRHGAQLLRIKGLLDVSGSETPVAVHVVQHVIHTPEHLPAWPSAERRSQIVFIVEGLDADAIGRSFACFMHFAGKLLPASRPAGSDTSGFGR